MAADCNVASVITPDQAVDAINDRFGRHPGCRALHAKGILVAGTFTATPDGARLTRARHMQGEPVRATVRFSNAAGDPDEPDYRTDVRGMATKLYLPDDTRTDIVAQTSARFPARTPDGFIEFIKAAEPGVHVAWRLPWFFARHREALAGLRTAAAAVKPPASYATMRYYAIHAFRWVDADGGARHVRYRWVPEAGVQTLGGKEAKERGRDYLQDEIRERVERGPVRFTLELQIVPAGDDVDDPTSPWRDDAETIAGATLELTGPETGRETGGDVLVFDPTRVPDGIELTDDPVLRFRADAYAASIERRSGATR